MFSIISNSIANPLAIFDSIQGFINKSILGINADGVVTAGPVMEFVGSYMTIAVMLMQFSMALIASTLVLSLGVRVVAELVGCFHKGAGETLRAWATNIAKVGMTVAGTIMGVAVAPLLLATWAVGSLVAVTLRGIKALALKAYNALPESVQTFLDKTGYYMAMPFVKLGQGVAVVWSKLVAGYNVCEQKVIDGWNAVKAWAKRVDATVHGWFAAKRRRQPKPVSA